MKFVDRVLQKEFILNDTDDSIVQYIIKCQSNIENVSIQQVANDLFVAPNAIMRLSRKLGYQGFSELKAMVKLEQNKETDEIKNLLSNSIMKTLDILDFEKLNLVCNRIVNAKKVHFIGVGESLNFCNMMVDNLRAVGKDAESYSTYREIEYRLCRVSNKDLVFVISASGENNRLLEYINNARENGAFIVTVTHFYRNSIASNAGIPLYFWGDPMNFNGYNLTDRTGMMILLRELSEEFWKIYVNK